MPKRPSSRIDVPSVKVIPVSSGTVLDREERALVDVEADSVAHPVAEAVAEAGRLDRLAARRADLARERARPGGGAAGLLRLEQDALHLLASARAARRGRTWIVRPKSEQQPFQTAPKSNRTGSRSPRAPVRRRVAGVEPRLAPGEMCVGKEGRERRRRSWCSTSSTSSLIVTPACTRRDRVHRLGARIHARSISSSSAGDRCRSSLTRDEPSLSSACTTASSSITASAQSMLEAIRFAELADCRSERFPAAAVVLDDDRARRRPPLEVEADEHPREHIDRAPGRARGTRP